MIRFHSRKPLESLGQDLEKAVADNGFSVLTVHDLTAKLKAKGVPLAHTCKVYEVCNPQQAKAVLDRDLSISTALPCRIAVYDAGEQLELATMEPTQLLAAFDRPELEAVAREVEDTLRRIMATAAGE
jgi:uncharacterized protein (DUF302 family)